MSVFFESCYCDVALRKKQDLKVAIENLHSPVQTSGFCHPEKWDQSKSFIKNFFSNINMTYV